MRSRQSPGVHAAEGVAAGEWVRHANMAERKGETVYRQVTDRMTADLERGRVPWVQPWGTPGSEADLGLPRNASTAKTCSGINILIIWGAVVVGPSDRKHADLRYAHQLCRSL